MGRESNPAAGAKAWGTHPPSSSSLYRTRRESSYSCVKQAKQISPTLIVPQEQPFPTKLAKLSSTCPLPCKDALPLPSIFSSLANSPNMGKAFRQNDRDFANTVQLPHVIFRPEGGKQFSHIPLTSGQKSRLEWIRKTAWFCDAVNHSACPSCRNPPAPSSNQPFHS